MIHTSVMKCSHVLYFLSHSIVKTYTLLLNSLNVQRYNVLGFRKPCFFLLPMQYHSPTFVLKLRFLFFYFLNVEHKFYFVDLNDSVEFMIWNEIVGTCISY